MNTRIPQTGEILTAADGRKFVVGEVQRISDADEGIDYTSIELVEGDDLDDFEAIAHDLNEGEFQEFCERNGIRY